MATRKPLIVNPTVSQIQELPTGDSLDGITDLTATGTITANQFVGNFTGSQPTCLLTAPVVFTANGPQEAGDNNKPISFQNVTTNVGCTTSLAPNATDITTGISSITVPSNGTYLVSALITGVNNMSSSTTDNDDQVLFSLARQDTAKPTTNPYITGFPNPETFPTFVFGGSESEEFHASFTLPLTLNANDTLSVHVSHIDASQGQIDGGYFSVVKLH